MHSIRPAERSIEAEDGGDERRGGDWRKPPMRARKPSMAQRIFQQPSEAERRHHKRATIRDNLKRVPTLQDVLGDHPMAKKISTQDLNDTIMTYEESLAMDPTIIDPDSPFKVGREGH